MHIPFFTLARQFSENRDRFMKAIEDVLSTGQVLQGNAVQELERRSAELSGRSFGVAVGSCTDALAFALEAHGIGPGDEVLVTAFSFVPSASAIVRVGATPVFVDIDPAYYMMDLAGAERLITSRTRGILAVNLYGQVLAMDEVESFANKHRLILIEDAAQSIGATYRSRPAGNLGVSSCLSFDPTKVIGSFSSAGMLVTDDAQVASKVRMLRYHGQDPKTKNSETLGYNSQLPTLMAATLLMKLGLMSSWQERRSMVAKTYLDGLSSVSGLVLPSIRDGSSHNWHKFVVRVADRRERLIEHLKTNGIETRVHYPFALPDNGFIRSLQLPTRDIPQARKAAREVLSLPIFAEMTEDEARQVVSSIRVFFGRS